MNVSSTYGEKIDIHKYINKISKSKKPPPKQKNVFDFPKKCNASTIFDEKTISIIYPGFCLLDIDELAYNIENALDYHFDHGLYKINLQIPVLTFNRFHREYASCGFYWFRSFSLDFVW